MENMQTLHCGCLLAIKPEIIIIIILIIHFIFKEPFRSPWDAIQDNKVKSLL